MTISVAVAGRGPRVCGIPHVARRKSAVFLEFSADWKTGFSATIRKKDFRRFASLPPESLQGKTIRLRGWVYEKNGPMIDLTWPGQVDILNQASDP